MICTMSMGYWNRTAIISFVVNLFAVVFTAMISLIAVANVFNTISTNIKLRRREFAMLRSVGMSDRDFTKMMRFECVLYGARTMLWGLPLSGILSFLIYKGMMIGGGENNFVYSRGAVSAISVYSACSLWCSLQCCTRLARSKEKIL